MVIALINKVNKACKVSKANKVNKAAVQWGAKHWKLLKVSMSFNI